MFESADFTEAEQIGIILGAIAVVIIIVVVLICISCSLYKRCKRRDGVNPNYAKVPRRQAHERTYNNYGSEAYGSFGQVITLAETKERRASTNMYDSKESILSEQLEEMQFLPPQDIISQNKDFGKLKLSIGYQEHSGLVITIHQVYDLPVKSYGGSTDPFVRFALLKLTESQPSFSFQTTIKHKTLNPIFEESFDAAINPMDIQLYRLTLYVCEHHKFTKPSVVGEVSLNLAEVDFTGSYRDVFNIQPSAKSYFGEICISLCYLSTSNRLIVGVLRATNLKPTAGSSQCDTCVRVTLILGGRKLKRRRTQSKENDLNPEFDELMYFEVPQEKLDKVKFLIVVTNSKKIEDPSEDTTMDELGRVLIGRKCSVLSYEHWNEMMRYPRRPFAQWYSLVE
ncbi:synaptotagmin-A-like isoform X2 [Anneissia japonica]|nr:synaptotagmin-A-like isoform X2 [Anneissia japonica]